MASRRRTVAPGKAERRLIWIERLYLLDTNVISELRRNRPHGAVVAWLESVGDAELFISAATIGELQAGVEKMRAQDIEKASVLEAWLDRVESTYSIIDMDGGAFRIWARLMRNQPNDMVIDAMLAATAQARGLTVVTRNVKDFERFGAVTFNPFTYREP